LEFELLWFFYFICLPIWSCVCVYHIFASGRKKKGEKARRVMPAEIINLIKFGGSLTQHFCLYLSSQGGSHGHI
jgi:hypothetical protein